MVGFINHIRPDADVRQFDPSIAGRPHAGFDWSGYQLIVMDTRLAKEDGLQWFQDYSADKEDFPPLIFLSSQNDVDVAVQAMKLGARDFLSKKNIRQDRLKQAILDALPPPADLMPDLKPLPDRNDTLDYGRSDTQVLPDSVRDKVAAAKANEVEEVEDDEMEHYWAEQTQILHEPPA